MFKAMTIAQRLWLWALLATLLFVLAVVLGAYGLQQCRHASMSQTTNPCRSEARPRRWRT
jgi:hypothetical protein